ncbi:Urease accessory protein UreF [hydrothermal vent metagenome]|uniref:Urease accessory protein UreF n=1 Tax=hydrothermal vent metagenome TaxID=652676 RepID=A0A3B0ZB23_9ZZZZ
MTEMPSISVLRLLQLVSPTLPVGAYAYSGGLESAVAAGWVSNAEQTCGWIDGVLEYNLCGLDVPVLQRMYHAWQQDDAETVRSWSRFLAASRESAELLAEDRQMGQALARLLVSMDIEAARDWVSGTHSSWVAMFALASVHWGIAERDAQLGYLWSWCENQVAAAVKLVPLGQTAGQQILAWCGERIPMRIERCHTLHDDDIGQLAPALAIISAQHEQQYSRLFRS